MSKFVVFQVSTHENVARRAEDVKSVEKVLIGGEYLPKVIFNDGEYIIVKIQTFGDVVSMLNEYQ